MKRPSTVSILSLFVLLLLIGSPSAHTAPPTHSNDIQHSDPYRWLETDSSERLTWVREQNRATKNFLRERPSRVTVENFFKKAFSQQQKLDEFATPSSTISLVYEGLGKPTKVIKKLSDGTQQVIFNSYDDKPNGSTAVMEMLPSPDLRHLIVVTTQEGSIDDHTLHIIEIESGHVLEKIENVALTDITWLRTDEFAYRVRINKDSLTFKHKIGTDPLLDTRFSKNDGDYPFNGILGQDVWLFVIRSKDIRFRRLNDETWYTSTVGFSGAIGRQGDTLLVRTAGAKRRGQIERIQLTTQQVIQKSEVVIPESSMVLRSAQQQGEHLVLRYQMAATQRIVVTALDGTLLHRLLTPPSFAVSWTQYDHEKQVLTLNLRSQIQSKVFHYDLTKRAYVEGDPEDLLLSKDGVTFVSEVVNASSANSTQVPVRITYKKGLRLNGENPTVLEGYGGFGIPGNFDPSPRAIVTEFLKQGGVYVGPALRGGNELGDSWHENGAGDKKQNVFNDMIATAEYLIERGFTSPARLALMGASNGGLLVSAVATQRPDLFRLAIPMVGVHDLLRKERLDPFFDEGWSYEYGSSDVVDDFKTLSAYSPIHNLKPQIYPTFLIVSGANDSRVNPAHSYKLTAALQNMQTGTNPILLSSYKNAGHWLTAVSLQGWISWRANTDIWSTIFDELGMNSANLTENISP